MLSFVLAESSLELVPKSIQNHPSVVFHAKKLGKNPSEILLDNSWHFAATKGIENELKRGRPDLVHLCLLEACTIPLYFENKIQIFLHTIDDKVILFGKGVRIPKSYHRFEGLIEKLYKEKTIQDNGNILLDLKKMNFSELLDLIKPVKVIGFSKEGKLSSYQNIVSKLNENCCIVIGGFQKGHFSEKIKKRIDELNCTDKRSLEAHVIVSRILYEYEKTIFK
ncbi:MAG: Ribosomal RNA small subunit methyltransferase Nep1 [Nitrosopumilales archaeon]|nr:MAG: Ribosomal RNA small subunit methyltransferase Nep1 [Nitrosopumilales archaeon]